MLRKIFSGLLLCLFLVARMHGQQTAEKFVQETEYLLSLPENYKADSTQRWPLVLFLHGSGESGHDLQKVKAHGPPELADKGRKFPFVLVSPQSDKPSGWDTEMLYKLLQDIKRKYRIDNDRVYLTGLSMGGFGTWALAMKYPDEFAAIAPICGGGDTATAWKMRNIPVWCFHGAKDDVVPPAGSINLVNASSRYNPSVRFTLYPDANHNSWDLTYNNDSLYIWMMAQRKHYYKEVEPELSLLKNYEGLYKGPDGDTVKLYIANNRLMARPGHDTIVLKAAAANLFFLDAGKNMDIRFAGSKGKASEFVFLGDRKLVYRRISK
jgi:predicted esterase